MYSKQLQNNMVAKAKTIISIIYAQKLRIAQNGYLAEKIQAKLE